MTGSCTNIFAEMRPGARVVSHHYPLGPWQPDRHLQFDVQEKIEISGTTRTALDLSHRPRARRGGVAARAPGHGDEAAGAAHVRAAPGRDEGLLRTSATARSSWKA